MSLKTFLTRRFFLGMQVQLIVMALCSTIAGAIFAGNSLATSFGSAYASSRASIAKIDQLATLTLAIKEMQLAVVGLQRAVSHFSATYSNASTVTFLQSIVEIDGLAEKFNVNADRAKQLAIALNIDQVVGTIDHVNRVFPWFLANGKTVEKGYFSLGTEGRVALIKQFDDTGDAMVARVAELIQVTQAESSAATENIDRKAETIGQWITWFQRLLLILSAGVFVAIVSIMLYVYHGIAEPLKRLLAAMQALARGDSDTSGLQFDRADEIGLLAQSLDTVRRASAERSQRETEVRLAQWRELADATVEGLIVCDGDKPVTANRSFEVMAGRSIADMKGMTVPELFRDSAGLRRFSEEEGVSVELELAAANDTSMPVEVLARNMVYLGKPCRILALRDLSERKRAEGRIKFLAHHDPMTGLANRHWFGEEMEIALRRVGRNESVAVLCLDLDQFKQVNDTFGHGTGDSLLQAVAQRIKRNIRQEDVVARMGGDEFAIIQIGAEQPEGATTLAKRLNEIVSEPYQLEGHYVVVGTSIGISIAPTDGTETSELLKKADLALYRAKSEGRGVFRLFERGMDEKMHARRSLENDLRKALSNNEFELFYQPQIDAKSKEVNSFEALLRWRHPERGLVAPLDFIPVAEEIGLMAAIGAWVLRQSCVDAMSWPKSVGVAVNVSAAQFRNHSLEEDVRAALEASGFSPCRLELEITESILLENTEKVIDTLSCLRASGIKIAMDDFGTGYSSLSYLSRFAIDKIKIDRSFIAGTDESSLAVIRAVVGLSASLGMASTAEGVETLDQFALLQAEGCTEVQGYLFSKPIPAAGIAKLMKTLSQTDKQAA